MLGAIVIPAVRRHDDGLDPELAALGVDEGDYFLCWLSSPAPKKLAARFRISLARLSSRASCSSSLTSCDSAVVTPGADPSSISARRDPRTYRLDPIAELVSDLRDCALLGAELSPQRTHHPHHGGLLLRAVPATGRLFPDDDSVATPASSFPRSGASGISRACQLSAPADHSGDQALTYAPAWEPLSAGTLKWSSANIARPHFWAKAATATNPAHDT